MLFIYSDYDFWVFVALLGAAARRPFLPCALAARPDIGRREPERLRAVLGFALGPVLLVLRVL